MSLLNPVSLARASSVLVDLMTKEEKNPDSKYWLNSCSYSDRLAFSGQSESFRGWPDRFKKKKDNRHKTTKQYYFSFLKLLFAFLESAFKVL